MSSMGLNSPLNLWLDFNLFDSLPAIENCTANGTIANCTYVCANANSLFNPFNPANLVTCGLWETVTAAINLGTLRNTSKYTAPFEDLGLSMGHNMPVKVIDEFLSGGLPSIIADCFYSLCKYWTLYESWACDQCSWTTFFGLEGTPESVSSCLNMICTPRGSLDPDLRGIGIFTSFIIQSSIAVVAFVLLLSNAIWHERNGKRRRSPTNDERQHFTTGRTPEDHTEILITAVVEFQKSQCYFAGAIQIAAIITMQHTSFQWDARDHSQFSAVTFIICTNGYVPVIFTLICVGCYGRQSWFLTLLALCCFMLSTVTLVYFNYFYALWARSTRELSESYGTCGGWAPEQLSPWCGSGVLMPTAIDSGIATSGWNYVMWIVSLSWAVYSVVKQASAGGEPHRIASHSLIARFALRWRSTIAFCDRWIKAGLGERGKDRAFWFLFLTSWSMAFGYQFYAYSLFFRYAQVESTWSFGQIVAVMVWIPAIAEYIYLLRYGIREGSEYRLRAPLTVTRGQPTLTTHEFPVQPHQHSGNEPRASLSEHGHSGTQGNESAMLPTTWSNSNIEIEMNTILDEIQRVGRV